MNVRERKSTGVSAIVGLCLWVGCWGAAPAAHAQAERADSAAAAWKTSLINKINATQAGYKNWSKGGANTLAFVVKLEGAADRTSDSWLQKHEMRLAYGMVRQQDEEVRKADDQIYFSSSLQYDGDGFFRLFNPTIANQIRTQWAPGFDYKRDPLGMGYPPPVKISDFLSPAMITQSLGLTYDPAKWLTQRFGFGAKETVVLIERLQPYYFGDTLSRPVQYEVGLESRTQFNRELFENVRLKSTLSLFASFNQDTPDVIWENVLAMKVNSWLGVNFEFDALYERDYRPPSRPGERMRAIDQIQMKEVLSLSVTVVII